MTKFLFKKLLAAHYSFARRWVNKKMPENVVPSVRLTFLTQFTFIAAGLYCVLLGSIEYKFDSYTPIFIGFMIIALGIGYGFMKPTEKAIFQWGIEKEYKTLSKNQRFNRNTFAFLSFWGSFAIFFYLGVKFIGGYLVK